MRNFVCAVLLLYAIFNNMKYPTHIVAVGTLVKNAQGNFLLVKTEWRGWEIPGGQVEEGEDIPSALQREVLEESGIIIDIKEIRAIYSSVSEPSKVIMDFISEYKSGDIKKATSEILDARWFSQEELLQNIQSDIMRFRVQWLLNNSYKLRHVSYTKNPFEILSDILI